MSIRIEVEACTGCARCLRACPYQGVDLKDSKAVFNDRCTQCGSCVEACRDEAIIFEPYVRPIPDFSEYSGVYVLAETDDQGILPVSLELLGEAARLAKELGEPVGAILVGSGVESLTGDLIAAGAETVHVVDDERLAEYLTLPYTRAAAQAVSAAKPSILLIGATPQGRDLAPRLTRRLGLGLTADCTELGIDPEEKILLQTRPAFGGNVMATITSRYSRPQTASVRPGIMAALEPDPDRTGEVIEHELELVDEDLSAVLKRVVTGDSAPVDLAKAKVVVAGGRGLGDADGFRVLEDLAQALDGEVGGTRVAYEEGWIPHERQIGQTGATIRPELYFAVGLSGAIQHRAGIMDSRYIVAINKDPGAVIFEIADFGLVGDFRVIIPAIIEALGKGVE